MDVAKELLQWVLSAVYGPKDATFDEMEYFPQYFYKLPQQSDGYNCGVYVSLYMTMLARNLITYDWKEDIDSFRWKLALALEKKNPEMFLATPTYT